MGTGYCTRLYCLHRLPKPVAFYGPSLQLCLREGHFHAILCVRLQVVPGSLHLGSDGRGRPSGEGWLTFENAEEARAVARAKNKQFMGKRYLELSLC